MLKQSYGLRLREALGFDYLVIGGLTADAQSGNKKPRIFKFPKEQSIVNGMGLPGDGIDAEIARLEKRKLKGMMPNVPLIANLCNSAGTSTLEGKIAEFKLLMEKLYPYVQGFEINVSCPNQCGVTNMQAEENIKKLVCAVKENNEHLAVQHGVERKTLLVKIAPLTRELDTEKQEFKNLENIKDLTPEGLKIIASVCEGNVEGITATNTAQEHDFREKPKITTST
jgi:dihydroorotate dehydrogenase